MDLHPDFMLTVEGKHDLSKAMAWFLSEVPIINDKPIRGKHCGLNEKCSQAALLFEHVVFSLGHCLRRLWNL